MTQKSESVRESEQHRTIEDLVHEFTLLHYPACKISREAMSDGLMLLARNVIKLLAEEAAGHYSSHPHRVLGSECASRFAAWLREKARQ